MFPGHSCTDKLYKGPKTKLIKQEEKAKRDGANAGKQENTIKQEKVRWTKTEAHPSNYSSPVKMFNKKEI